MDLVSALAPPRLCRLDGETYWVRPFTLGDYAVLLAWLDDVLPGKAERTTPPLINADESQAALSSMKGWELQVWLGLRGNGTTWNEASAIAREATDIERVRFIDAIYARRRTWKPGPGGEDLGAIWAGPIFAGTSEGTGMCERFGMSLDDVARLTLDQVDCLQSGGAPDEDPRRATHEQLTHLHELALANREAKERKPDQPSGFETALAEAVERFESARTEVTE